MERDVLEPLRRELKARGFLKRRPGRVMLELALHVAMALAGIAVFLWAEHPALRLLGLCISTLGSVGVGTNTHTATHFAASHSRLLNEALAHFGYPFFLQLSLSYWRHQHIVVHHPNPNVSGLDDDADFTPFFASTDRELAAGAGFFQRHVGHQWIVFPLIVWVHGYVRQINGWKHVCRMLADPKRRKLAHVLDAAAMGLHYVAWFVIPSFFFPVAHVIAFNLIRIGLLGYPLFFVLAPGHYPEEAQVIAREADWQNDHVYLQTAATINFRTGIYGRLLCSGLEYQIEHHLFPGYSHVHYRAMSPLIQAFCKQHGYPYRVMSWPAAIWSTLRIFYRPKHVAGSIAELKEKLAESKESSQR